MIALCLTATCIYILGLIGVASGRLTPSLFPDRYIQNLIGSLLSAALGFVVTLLPRLLAKIEAHRDRAG